MEYFSIISYGIAEIFNIVGQIKMGEVSYLNLCLVLLVIALIWRFVLQPLFVHNSLGGADNVNKRKSSNHKKVNNE